MKTIKLSIKSKRNDKNETHSLVKMEMKNKENTLEFANLLRRKILKETVRLKNLKLTN